MNHGYQTHIDKLGAEVAWIVAAEPDFSAVSLIAHPVPLLQSQCGQMTQAGPVNHCLLAAEIGTQMNTCPSQANQSPSLGLFCRHQGER